MPGDGRCRRDAVAESRRPAHAADNPGRFSIDADRGHTQTRRPAPTDRTNARDIPLFAATTAPRRSPTLSASTALEGFEASVAPGQTCLDIRADLRGWSDALRRGAFVDLNVLTHRQKSRPIRAVWKLNTAGQETHRPLQDDPHRAHRRNARTRGENRRCTPLSLSDRRSRSRLESHDLPSFRQNRGPMLRPHAQPGEIPRFFDLSGETRGALVFAPQADQIKLRTLIDLVRAYRALQPSHPFPLAALRCSSKTGT